MIKKQEEIMSKINQDRRDLKDEVSRRTQQIVDENEEKERVRESAKAQAMKMKK